MDHSPPLTLRFGAFALDEANARVTRDGRPVALTPKALGVLCELARRPGQLVSKSALLEGVWGHQYVSDSVLKTTISELRAALGDDARQPRLIETAARRGYRFIGAAAAPPPGPALAAAAAPAPPTTLVGRGAARARLQARWADAAEGRRQIVWVCGEAGIGKTSLIEQFAVDVGGAAAVHGQCVDQHGAGEPYLPILEALAALCRADDAMLPLLRRVAPTWLLQLPWLIDAGEADALSARLAGSGPERMLREFGELLERCTQQRPLLLVTEDLHWSDGATLRLIDHVARRRAPARLMWLASCRLAEAIAEDHPLKALRHELRLHRLVDEVPLDLLSEHDVAALLAARLPRVDDGGALARALHARTEGLPLFVAHEIDDLIARKLPHDRAAEDWRRADASVPESLAGVVEHQLGRLPADVCTMLETASVCGPAFRPSVVAEVMARDPGPLGEQCEALARAGHWLVDLGLGRQSDGVIEGRYAFRHALYRQVLYQRIGPVGRMQRHGRMAAALARRRHAGAAVTSAELAMHCEQALDPMAAMRHYADAAEAALQRFAPDEALNLSSRGLGLLTSCAAGAARDRVELALLGPRVAAWQQVSLVAPDALATWERVRTLREHWQDTTSGLDIELGWIHCTGGDHASALRIAEDVQADADVEVNRVRYVAACNLHGTVLSYLGRLGEARHWLAQGLAACVDLGDRPGRARAVVDLEVSLRCRLAQVLAHQGDIIDARAQLDRAGVRAAQRGPFTRRLAFVFDGLFGMRVGEVETVRTTADALQRLAVEDGLSQAEGPARWLRGWTLTATGDPSAGHELIDSGDALDAALGIQRGRSGLLGHSAHALLRAGQAAQALQRVDQALALADRMGERLYRPDLLLVRSRIEHALGREAAALETLLAAWQEAAQQGAGWLALGALVALAEVGALQPDQRCALAELRAAVACKTQVEWLMRADAALRATPCADGKSRANSDRPPTLPANTLRSE